MKTFAIRAAVVVLAFLLLCLAVFWTPDTDPAEMIAKYGGPNPQFITVEPELRVHVRDQGLQEGPVLLLIHGANNSLHVWEQMVAELGNDFRLISLDLPGHGLTGAHPRALYSPEATADVILAVLDELEIDQATWVGNSFGGWIAWRAALAHSERMDGLVLMAASGAVTGEEIEPYLAAKIAASPVGQLLLTRITPKFLIRSSVKQVVSDEDLVTDSLVNQFWELIRFPGNRDALLHIQKLPRQDENWTSVGEISVPTLILWGEDDITVPSSHGQAFAEKITGSTIMTYSDAAHLMMLDVPLEMSRDITDWHQSHFQPDN